MKDEFSEENKHDSLMFYFFLAIFTGGIGIIVDLFLRIYTGKGLKERLEL